MMNEVEVIDHVVIDVRHPGWFGGLILALGERFRVLLVLPPGDRAEVLLDQLLDLRPNEAIGRDRVTYFHFSSQLPPTVFDALRHALSSGWWAVLIEETIPVRAGERQLLCTIPRCLARDSARGEETDSPSAIGDFMEADVHFCRFGRLTGEISAGSHRSPFRPLVVPMTKEPEIDLAATA